MDPRSMLAPLDGVPMSTANGTPLSRYCEAIVSAFLDGGAPAARVRCEDSDYTLDELYGGMRRVCRKMDYRARCAAHRRDGALVLARKDGCAMDRTDA